MPRPVHFEIPSDHPENAIAFYSAVFGWTFHKWEGPMPYWLITTGPNEEPGINGGLLPRRDPAQPCVNTINVPNLDETQATIEAKGGVCCVPKMPVPTVGWLAYFKDLDGNIFGVMQMDPSVT
jgi:predicted enzyme related to lactoylglutathione lyase